MDNLRKALIAEKLGTLIVNNPDMSVASLMHTIMRTKGKQIVGGYHMADEDFSSSLEDVEGELDIKDWNFTKKETL